VGYYLKAQALPSAANGAANSRNGSIEILHKQYNNVLYVELPAACSFSLEHF
jgi:hypothetical protein